MASNPPPLSSTELAEIRAYANGADHPMDSDDPGRNVARWLLDENARLNAHAENGWDLVETYIKQLETPSAQWGKTIDELEARNATVEALSARLTAKNAELDRVIREAAADKAKLAAVEKAVRDSYPWECDSPTHNRICHLRALTPINIALGYGSEMPRPPAEEARERVSGLERRETRTGVPETLSEAQAIESGRRIAVSMMDRAEAKYRHEHGQPHRREHCETCAEECWTDRLRPVHYREAAASLRKIAAGRISTAPDALAYARAQGLAEAADMLDSVARDLDEAPSLPVPSTDSN